MTDLSQYSDEELERIAAGASASPTSLQIPVASAPAPTSKPLSEWTDEELEAYVAQSQGQGPAAQSAQESAQVAQPAQPPRKMTREERIAQNQRAIARAQQPGEGETGFWGAAGEALAEGARGAGRALKAAGQGILGTVTSAVRLAGTPVRAVTGWDGIHRLADKIDSSYENFGRDALMSEYGENPDGWGYALGRAGEKVAGVAGSLAGLGAAGKAVQAVSGAAKMAGLARTAKVAENALPLMFGNDAAVRAYDTARANGKSKTEAASLAGLNGAIHFFGFKAFENQSLKKMLNIGPEVEVMMPKWADALADEGGQSFSSLVRGMRNGMVKYIAAERGKGALKAGGIMGLQDMLSDPVMQVAEGADIDDIDFSRMFKAGAHGVGEGVLMEGLMGGAAIFKSQKAAEKFMADKFFRGKDYKVMGADGKMHKEDGLLESPQGRMMLMKQNPDATTRVLDIVDHDGKPRPEELDAAFLPPDMTAEELRKFHDDWRKDLLNNMGIDPDAQPTPRLGYQINVGERPPAQEWQGAENPGIAFDELVRRGTAGQGRPETSPETTTQERPNETGNRADEAPARPEQGSMVGRPAQSEAAEPVESAAPRAEASREGVVEQGKGPDAAAPSAATPAKPAEKPSTTALKPTEAQTPAEPVKPVEAPSRPSDAKPAVSAPDKASDAQKAALAKLGEGEGVAVTSAKMGKGGVLRVKYTMPSADGRVVEFDSTIDAEGKTSTSVAGVKAESVPALATQDQTNIPNEKKTSPAPAQKSNRLRRADGTDPLAEREQAATQSPAAPAPTGAETPAPVSRTVRGNLVEKRLRPIIDFVRNEDGSFNPDALRNHDGNNGLPLKDLKLLNEHPEIVDDLGLPAEDAAALKSALTNAYNTQRVATPNSKEGKVSEAGQANYSVSASKALERLAKHPNNLKSLVIAQQQVSAAYTAAKDSGDTQGAKFWEGRLTALNEQIGKLPANEQAKIQGILDSINGTKSAMERKNTQSLESGEGKTLDVADGGAADVEAPATPAPKSGSTGQGGALGGNRHLIIDSVKGDNLTVTMKDAAGKVLVKGQKMTRAQWAALANGADAVDGDPAAPQKGDLIRRAKSDVTDLPDAWTPETQKSLERVANVLRNVVTVGGKRVKVLFVPRPKDADGNTRKSISGIYTGSAADYANRSRQGGVDDGPSLHKIGTGEGTANEAWGLYFTNAPGIAGRYANQFVYELPKQLLRKGTLVPKNPSFGGDGKDVYERLRRKGYSNDKVIEILKNNYESHKKERLDRFELEPSVFEKDDLEALDFANKHGNEYEVKDDPRQKHAYVYEQTIFTDRDAADDSHILDWNKKVDDTTVKMISDKLGQNLEGGDGQHIYNQISSILRGKKEASIFLRDKCDIDGVRYQSPASEGPGHEFTTNYISFRDDNIRVDHKWKDGRMRYMRNSEGVTVGEYDAAKGEIRLYPGARVADVVHEFTHPLVDYARAEAKAGRGELLGKINQIIDAERATWEQPVRDAYKGKSNETILEEIFTHAMGEKGAKLFGKSTNTLQGRQWYKQLWEKIKGLWQDFATKMGWNKADLRGLDRMSPEDAARHILSEMAKGRSFGDAKTGGEGTRNAVRKGVSPAKDATYMDAVKRGDTKTAQRMVFARAREVYGDSLVTDSSGDPVVFYHGSKQRHNVFDPRKDKNGFGDVYFTDTPEYARKFGDEVQAVILVADNPSQHDFSKEGFRNAITSRYSGHDSAFVYGVMDFTGIRHGEVLMRKMENIKSADPVTYDDAGNVIPLSQRFNPKSNDIRYSRRVVLPKPPTTKDVADWLDGKDDVRRKWRRALQDKNIGIRDVEEKLGITDKNESAYYAKDRAFGKNEHELTVLQKQEVEPIVEKIHKSGGDLGLFSAYLYACHAGERNAVLKAERGVDNGSGMNDAQAKAIFDAVDRQGLRAAFEDAAKDVWAMNRKYLQRRVDAGRMTQAEADFLMKRYQHYVPLRTDMTNEELDIFNSTTGGWKRNETMTAKGRKSAADDPLAFSIVQNEQAIRASNVNEVRKRWAGVVRRAKGELGEIVDGVNKGTAKWAFTFGDGETVETGSPMKLASERDDIILFKENGQLKAIKMKPGEHGRGIELARAVTDKDVVKFNEHLDWIPRATRWMSAMRTQYVPTFIVRNLKADNLEVMLNALSERGLRGENGKSGGVAFFGKFLKNEVSVAKGVKEYFKTGKSSDKYVQEAVENGLLTGGGMAAEGFTETARRLSDTLQALRERPKLLGGTLKAAKDTISLLNSCAEYNTRMGVYKTLREEGVSVADAVSYARDVTVNFNRKGYLTPYTNAAFMFSNAAIQGMGRAFKSMGSEHGKGVVAGLFMVGVAQALLDDWLGHDDEKEKMGGADSRNMTEYDKEHSLGVALPTGHRVKTGIRNPWALPVYAGRKTVELVKGITSGEQAMKDLANAVGNFATEPVGGNGFGSKAEFLQTLAPTIIDPFVQWGTGKDYRGQDRLKKSFDKTAPQSWNGKERTPEAYKLLAQGLNALTGGNEFRKGWGDSAPEDWQLLTETVFGGVLTDLNNLVKAGGHAVDVARGKPAAQIVRDVPFVRDTVTNLPENTNRYYAALDAYERDKAEFKKTTDPERRKELRADKPYLFAGKSLLDGQIDRVKELMHLERGEIKVGQKWVEPKIERTEEQKEKWRKQRLALQARILKRLGK